MVMFGSFKQFADAAVCILDEVAGFFTEQQVATLVAIDHVCYKCFSRAEYDRLRELLESSVEISYLFQIQLAGRRVAYFGLHQGLPVRGFGNVPCIEICDKRETHRESPGFHHVELYPAGIGYDPLLQALVARGMKPALKSRPHHTTFDMTLPSGLVVRLTERPLIHTIFERDIQQKTANRAG